MTNPKKCSSGLDVGVENEIEILLELKDSITLDYFGGFHFLNVNIRIESVVSPVKRG